MSKQRIKEVFEECIKSFELLEQLINTANEDFIHNHQRFQLEYQIWYSKAIRLLDTFGKDRLVEFRSYYEIDPKRKNLDFSNYTIQDFLKGVKPKNIEESVVIRLILLNLTNQTSLLMSIYKRLDTIVFNIQSEITNELQELELKSATGLLKINIRAGGIIAGVILENHLSKVVENHTLKTGKKNSSLSDFNECLKNNNVIDVTTWKKILYLSDLRNLCAHKKENEPTVEQVKELIDGTNWAIKNLY